MLLPAITQLQSGTGIVVAGRNPGIAFLGPRVDQCIDFERSGWHRLFTEDPAGDQKSRMPDVDYVIAFLNDQRGIIYHNLKKIYPARRIYMFSPFPPKNKKIHIAEYMAQCIQKAGLPIDPLRSMEESQKRPLLQKTGLAGRKGWILLHPGSGSVKKNYRPDLWLTLAEELRRNLKNRAVKIALLLGPAEEGLLSFFQEKLSTSDTKITFCPENENLMSILSQAHFFIGHDSGITHLTAMLGTPVIALFKDSCPFLWKPLGPSVHVMKKSNGEGEFIGKIVDRGLKYLSRVKEGRGT